MKTKQPIIAIDGPVGVGKSTVARELARRLDYLYIDTGAMYRAVTLAAMRAKIDLTDRETTTRLAQKLSIQLEHSQTGLSVLMNGEDVSEAIRDPEVSRNTSPISETEGIRKRLVELQKEMGRQGGVIMEGRDIGTVVFPNADYKFFLVADDRERARRRYLELKQKGVEQDFEQLLCDLKERDRRDCTRAISPLTKAEDAIEIDTTHLSLDQVIDQLAQIIHRRTS